MSYNVMSSKPSTTPQILGSRKHISGLVGSSPMIQTSEEEFYHNPDNSLQSILNNLQSFSEQLGPEFDLNNVIDSLKEASDAAQKKQAELNILTFIAFHANDSNIVEIRKQLFLTAKMMYEDRIKEIASEIQFHNDNYDDCSPTMEEKLNDKRHFSRLFEDFYSFLNRINFLKRLVGNK